MAVTFLQKVVAQNFEPKTDVITILRKNLGGYKPERSHETVHASDVTKEDFCPRQFALLTLLNETKKARYISTALQATFDIGNMTSDIVRERWLGASAVGNWRCVKCAKSFTFKKKPEANMPCKGGGCCEWKYDEVNFVCQSSDISGSIDVIVDLKAPKFFLVELKIIKPDDFEKIVAPLAEHRIRTNLYMRLVEESNNVFKGAVSTQLAKVLYVSRGYGKKNVEHGEILPFKEFDVVRDDSVTQPYVDKALKVKIFKQTGAIPAGVCKTTLDAPAKACKVCKQCFSGNYPVTQ